jgi:predicted RNase H-like HicB family nuclease
MEAEHITLPALPGCHISGHTYEEGLANIKEAVELHVEDLREAGKPIPVDSDKGTVELPTRFVAINL